MPKLILSAALAASLFFTAGSAVAQTTEDSTTTAVTAHSVITPAAFSSDSLQAVQKLFRSRRTGSAILGFPAGYMFGYGLASTVRGVDGAATTLVIGTVLSGITLSKSARFSKTREKEILNAYQQGKPLPAYVRTRIKDKHMKAAKPLEATAQRPTW